MSETERIIENFGGTVEQSLFPNGYGMSVARHSLAYGGCEIAVLHGDSFDSAPLCYATPVTDDVIGYCTEEDVDAIRRQIQALPPNPDCTHSR